MRPFTSSELGMSMFSDNLDAAILYNVLHSVSNESVSNRDPMVIVIPLAVAPEPAGTWSDAVVSPLTGSSTTDRCKPPC